MAVSRVQPQTDVLSRPTGAVAFALLFFFLKLNKRPNKPLREHVSRFDFIGLLLITASVALVLVGFSQGETDCISFRLNSVP
jgi:hypothetical protein